MRRLGLASTLVLVVVCIVGILSVRPTQATLLHNFKTSTDADSISSDAFGHLRVSSPTAQQHVTQIHDDAPILIDTVTSGTGASAHQANEASSLMTTAATSDYVIRQTFGRGHYQSGKSHVVALTVSGFELQTNVDKRLGYFSSSTSAPYTANLDGLFFSSEGGDTHYVNIYRNGTAVDRIARASWDDPLDGTGPSGVDAGTLTNNLIYGIDFQFLGVGRVRFTITYNGTVYIVHTENHSDIALPYMASPNQPLRWEIRQDGAGSGSMRQICGAISTEGSLNTIGQSRSVNMDTTHLDAAVIGTRYAAIGARLKSTYLSSRVDISTINGVATTGDNYIWEIILNPTVAGTFTYSAVSNSAVETATGATANTVTGGTILASGYSNGNDVLPPLDLQLVRGLGVAIDGTPDEIVIAISPLGANLDVFMSLSFIEFM